MVIGSSNVSNRFIGFIFSLVAQVLSDQPINPSVSNSSSIKCKSFAEASIDSEVLTHGVDVVAPKRLCSGTRAVLPMETSLLGFRKDLPLAVQTSIHRLGIPRMHCCLISTLG